jgi:type I restriction enzyme, R subunit
VPTRISESALEEHIEQCLLAGGPDDPAGTSASTVRETPDRYGEGVPGGWLRRSTSQYDPDLLLLSDDVLDFVRGTQPKTWERLKAHHGDEARAKFLRRLSREIEKKGTLHVLREGIRDSGCHFHLAFFKPSSGLNPDHQEHYRANLFSVIRQFHYDPPSRGAARGKSLDLGLFLNGIPIFTAELKNPLNRQNWEHAVAQYKGDRDPRHPLFKFGRCLAHFAADPDQVHVTTRLAGGSTRFLPFNQGWEGGAGNPPVPPTRSGYATEYLWSRIWARDSVLNLLQHFVHEVEDEDEDGKKTGKTSIIFPRYHQLDAVRGLVEDARRHGPGRVYLVQHSAGSGKSNSIAWLAHQLSVLHDASDAKVFDSIIVITDRRVLDRQLQRTVRQFERTLGVVENIDEGSRHLRDALEGGKQIIISTLQKFPHISEEMASLPGSRFAVIIDEAHSSQSGEGRKHLNTVLAAGSLEEAEAEDATEEDDLEDRIVREMKSRGRLGNVSTFAFTATPKEKTLELFGERATDGRYRPFSLYSMRQAIEEGFIMDVLRNYTTYRTYWRLLKTVENDPHYDREKAARLLRSFVEGHEHAIRKKVEIIVEHFHDQVAGRVGQKAKAMVVTRSRLHAVKFAQELRKYLKERRLDYGTLVAFSGTVQAGGMDYTESQMNGLPETQTAIAFRRLGNRFLVVANKFQTGFSEPLLHTMYVDKKLGGVNAVQTLSRLNRTHPEKLETMVLDFANEADDIQEAFGPYYEETILSEGTDPNILYDRFDVLYGFPVFTRADVDAFAVAYFGGEGQDRVYALLGPAVERFTGLSDDEKTDFRRALLDYTRVYSFLSQLLTFTDAELEKLYHFARLLRRHLPAPGKEALPVDVQRQIDIESFEVRQLHKGAIQLERGAGRLDPKEEKGPKPPKPPGELEPLSAIIEELNQRFGLELTPEDASSMEALETSLRQNPGLQNSLRVNPPENARLSFEQIAKDQLHDMVERNFNLYQRINRDEEFQRVLMDLLFGRMLKVVGEGEGNLGSEESTTRDPLP